ncbi:MAG: translation elongation factor Ts [Coleofasciculaceae cyanobacterium SM2_1_6]|nr:translation elongation factor Ts [Coleofasciculaceae cyanobacterium SM2_1_6]
MADISAKLVKELRDKTGAGMMDCKKALQESESDVTKAIEWLRQKGITSAEKKSGRVAAEGIVDSYIHTGGRVGVLVEINCETDFVARRDEFKTLAKNIAMQVAACPQVEYVRESEIPEEIIAKEKEIEMGRDDLGNKPQNIKEKIVLGRIEKRLKEISLMDQPYIRDQTITIDELVKQVAAQLGEKIEVRRFVRFVLGEGIEKEEISFADEVAAQMGKTNEAPKGEVPEAEALTPTNLADEVAAQNLNADEVADEVADEGTPEKKPEQKKSGSKKSGGKKRANFAQ